jgi:hypothetical protein
MNAVLDHVLVGVLLLASLGFAAYKLGPRGWRTRALQILSRSFASAPRHLHLQSVSERLALAAVGKPKGACGGCDSCGSETAATPQSAATEVRIPAAKIGRRG